MGIEQTVYDVLESEGTVEVCTVVRSPIGDCPIAIPFTVIITASEGPASKCLMLCCNYEFYVFCFVFKEMCLILLWTRHF